MSGIAILMRRRLMTVWLWVGLFVAAVIWDFVDHQLTVRAMMQPIRFAAMDSRDTFYLSSAASFDQPAYPCRSRPVSCGNHLQSEPRGLR